jgi:hypothetical protein
MLLRDWIDCRFGALLEPSIYVGAESQAYAEPLVALLAYLIDVREHKLRSGTTRRHKQRREEPC